MNFQIIIFLITIFTVQIYCDPQEDRVFLIDQYNQNLLYRGNDPCLNGQFQYKKLVSIMKNKAEKQHAQFPDDFELVVISVLKDYPINDIERDYFIQNPQKGEFINYPLQKEVYEFPGKYKLFERQYLASKYESWTKDHLGQVGRNIREQLITNDLSKAKARIVYFHCVSGIHLVHMPFGGYEITIHNWTNTQVLNWYPQKNLPIPGEPYQTGVSWYCLYNQMQDYSQDANCLYSIDI